MKKIFLITILSLGLGGCEKSQAETSKNDKAKISQAKEDNDRAERERVKDLVKSRLKDPFSAQFRNIKQNCGEVNAKNEFGGYTGFSRFVVFEKNTRVSIEDGGKFQYVFEALWNKYCK